MQTYSLPQTNPDSVVLLQITDTHLFANESGALLGVATQQSFHAVLNAVDASTRKFDAIVATGDISQDHTPDSYQRFAEGIARWEQPCFWLPGNHDYQPTMVTTLANGAGISDTKHILVGDAWQVVLLDSQVPGVPHGELSDYQLEWLERTLSAHASRHTLIFLHHHPMPSGCTWLDQHSLRNSHMLEAVLQAFPLAHTLVCGHIHQDLDLNWNGRRLLSTPSTCVQFKPHCTNFTIDTVPPGWRWLTLGPDGSVETEVQRLQTSRFTPDLDSEGY